MAGKKRVRDRHLPERVYLNHNAYFFVNKNNQWIRLGKTLTDAMQKWAEIVQPNDDICTMQQVFDRYMLEVAPKKAPTTYESNKKEILQLRHAYGHLSPHEIKPKHIYKTLDSRGKKAPVRANREKALLSHIFTYAIRWGIVDDNPCKHVQRIPEQRRDRYVDDAELQAIRNLATGNLPFLIDFAYVTGLRQLDILKLKVTDISDEGIYVLVNKTKTKLLIEWSDRLHKVVLQAKEFSVNAHSDYLFPNTRGQPYTSSGFRTIWNRLMNKALQQNVILERFHFHDLRRKTATDLDKKHGLEHARKLLGHTDQKMTSVYISGAQRVKPIE